MKQDRFSWQESWKYRPNLMEAKRTILIEHLAVHFRLFATHSYHFKIHINQLVERYSRDSTCWSKGVGWNQSQTGKLGELSLTMRSWISSMDLAGSGLFTIPNKCSVNSVRNSTVPRMCCPHDGIGYIFCIMIRVWIVGKRISSCRQYIRVVNAQTNT